MDRASLYSFLVTALLLGAVIWWVFRNRAVFRDLLRGTHVETVNFAHPTVREDGTPTSPSKLPRWSPSARAGWGEDTPPYRYYLRYTLSGAGHIGTQATATLARDHPIASTADLISITELLEEDFRINNPGSASVEVMILSWQRFEPEPPGPKKSGDLDEDTVPANVIVLRRAG